jgi:uncharacterized protein YdhG (YjbR/CyaY superfamily)
MKAKKPKPKTVDEYISALPKAAQKKLRELRACVRAAAPGAEEGLKWGMPAFSYKRILVTFAAFERHIGFYPTPAAVKAFAEELTGYVTSNTTVRFPLDKPLPLGLIRKMTKFRVRQSLEKDGKWRT